VEPWTCPNLMDTESEQAIESVHGCAIHYAGSLSGVVVLWVLEPWTCPDLMDADV
jgi:hypothetical protein